MSHWITYVVVLGIIAAGYVALLLWGRKRQRQFDAQFDAEKKTYDVFVLQKAAVWERPPGLKLPLIKVKTYQVTARMNVSQLMRGIEISRMQTVTLTTTKDEYQRIESSHRYRMDIAGNYIGNVFTPDKSAKRKNENNHRGRTEENPFLPTIRSIQASRNMLKNDF